MLSFSTRTAALRSLKDISIDAVKHAKQLLIEKEGKFYFDEDAADKFLNTQDDITNANLENNMTIAITLENLKTVATAELVTFYNDHAESSVKKFRDRATAEKKVQAILEALAEEVIRMKTAAYDNVAKSTQRETGSEYEDCPDGTDAEEMKVEAYVAAKTAPKTMSIADTVAFAKEIANKGKKAPKSIMGELMNSLVADPEMTPPEVREPVAAKTDSDVCPKCGSAELYTGRNKDGLVIDEDYIVGCHDCGWEEDSRKAVPETKATAESRQVSDIQAETMKTSLKLDRTIVCGDEEWKNAFQMWKAHTDWMTSAQQDGLTAKLYKAAKAGSKLIVTINGRDFQLKNV